MCSDMHWFHSILCLLFLNVAHNSLLDFPEDLTYFFDLVDLDISNNFITYLPSETAKMSMISHLNAKSNYFDCNQFSAIFGNSLEYDCEERCLLKHRQLPVSMPSCELFLVSQIVPMTQAMSVTQRTLHAAGMMR